MAEPQIIELIREHTAVPVPEVIGTSKNMLEFPCCLYERVPGRTFADRPVIESPDLLARICTEAGQHLAGLHNIDTFGRCGPIVLGDDGLTVANVADDWPSGFQRTLAAKVDQLGPQFKSYVETLNEHVNEATTKCRSTTPVTPVLAHMDYRLANLVIDPDADCITQAVLDWAGATAAPAAYELAHVEALLTDWPILVADQVTLWERFREAYAQRREIPTIPDIYRVDAQLRLMKHLDMEIGHFDNAAAEGRVEDHLTSLEALGAL
ncbi:aminoglycoside phosphotransferase [Halorubrum coriense DSM 10284]|uniref:Aminoglycoside phosphotransferase n=2 Tax=Halorubrum coriense TaxID=64713 RepID=M0ERU2_9EURY|nr:aminoglycoside phosphotransferase [Halorubrum coriense DSM 10284]